MVYFFFIGRVVFYRFESEEVFYVVFVVLLNGYNLDLMYFFNREVLINFGVIVRGSYLNVL